MSQPAFEGMPQRLYPAAPSRLTTYLDCPRRYRLGYLERPAPSRGAPWAHHSVGAAVHTALARWWDLPRDRRTPAGGGDLLSACWLTAGFRDDAQQAAVRDRTRSQVERYLAGVDSDVRPVGIERTVGVTTRHAYLWGRVDRVDDRAGEGLVVVDYKTGRSVPTVEDARTSLALAVYAAGTARELRRPCTRVELHHLPTGDVLVWDHTEESLGEHLRRADELAGELARLDAAFEAGLSAAEADERFPARVGERCGWCDFRVSCAPGQAVPARQSWAGVIED
ncbi:MAG TPA: PD-(D/E)XK nuclease family protein [Nocardioidaceae bacterium]|nr:PD-(D/E)XK nuclease family protein [Nocardioidaceae bacterium]